MKKSFTFIVLFILMAAFSGKVNAQIFGAPEQMKGKLVTGGNFGLGASGNHVYFGLAPQLGIRLTRSLEVGARLGYDFNYYYDHYYGGYFAHYFSGALYANFEIFRGIYVQVEDEEMCRLVSGKAVTSSTSRWYNSLFVGAGYRQYTTPTSFVYYSILYNLSWDYNYNNQSSSPYAAPFVVRIGFCRAL